MEHSACRQCDPLTYGCQGYQSLMFLSNHSSPNRLQWCQPATASRVAVIFFTVPRGEQVTPLHLIRLCQAHTSSPIWYVPWWGAGSQPPSILQRRKLACGV